MRKNKDNRREQDKFEHKSKAFRKLERRRNEDREQERELRELLGSHQMARLAG